ncbi:MAG: hypothetical protein F4X87_01475 [Chloroflexi bacterium]|nr:hypothetical protein [Chloroflexota bacterium]
MVTEAVNSRLDRVESRVDANVADTAELKGAYEHLATKADVEKMKVDWIKILGTIIAIAVAIFKLISDENTRQILERLP